MDRYTVVSQLLEQAWQEEVQFLEEQPLEERELPGTFERWSRKDVVAHIETWNSRLAENIRAGLRGETPRRYEDFNAENKNIYNANQGTPWQDTYEFAAQAHQNLITVVRELGSEGLERIDVLPWQEGQPIWRSIVGNGYNHALIHIGEHSRDRGDKAFYADTLEKMSLSTAGLDDSPIWQGNMLYNLACAHALSGQRQKALEELRQALRLNPRLSEWSRQDADLESLRGEPDYQALYSNP